MRPSPSEVPCLAVEDLAVNDGPNRPTHEAVAQRSGSAAALWPRGKGFVVVDESVVRTTDGKAHEKSPAAHQSPRQGPSSPSPLPFMSNDDPWCRIFGVVNQLVVEPKATPSLRRSRPT